MDKQITREQFERLQEIKDEMKNLLEEATQIIKRGPSITWERAKGYCIGNIATQLDNEHNFIGNSMFTLQEIIDDLEPCNDEDDENEENEEKNSHA